MDTTQESEEQEDSSEVEVPPPAPSYLPTWVLRMREKIESSRIAHADAESRIEQLNKGVDVLTDQLAKIEVAKQQRLHKANVVRTKVDKSNAKLVPHIPAIYSVPSEVFSNILEHLRLEQVVRLELVCKTVRSMLIHCSYWPQVLPLYCPHLVHCGDHAHSEADEQATAKQRIQQYLRNVKTCVSFIQTMKDQRCVPKHRSVQPHRHTRQERQVTHPLPVFQHSQSMHSSSNSGALSIASGGNTLPQLVSHNRSQSARSEDLIMSHAETLSSDFRSIAHKALSTLLSLSTDITDPFFYKLLSEGAVTVLTSLLSNEEGALQNYACSILANLLCWEARKIQAHKSRNRSTTGKRGAAVMAPSPQELACLRAVFGMTNETLSQTVSVSLQVSACGGLKLLTSLLTSPTAAINISYHSSSNSNSGGRSYNSSVSTSSGGDVQAGVGQQRAARGTTSSIQGMCNKQASRALITLVYPLMPVPLPAVSTVVQSPAKSPPKTCLPEHAIKSDPSEPFPGALPNSSGMSNLASRGVIPEHLRIPAVGGLFLSDSAPRPWQFSYFYKSGAVKDQFTAYLRFRHNKGNSSSRQDGASTIGGDSSAGATLRGRGVDSIGAFTLSGRAEPDISGWSWYINKSYVPFAVDQAPDVDPTAGTEHGEDYGNTADDALGVDTNGSSLTRMERWLQDVDGLLDPPLHTTAAASARAGGSSVHVTHVAYWSSGVEDEHRPDRESRVHNSGCGGQNMAGQEGNAAVVGVAPVATNAAAESELDFVDESHSGVWGVGLWGVWETSSGTGTHFELHKGGVFRAAPMALLSPS